MIAEAMREGAMQPLPAGALTAILAASFDRAALAIETGGRIKDYQQVLTALIGGLMSDRIGG